MFEETNLNNRKNNPFHWKNLHGEEKLTTITSIPFGLVPFAVLLFFADEFDVIMLVFLFFSGIAGFLIFTLQPIFKLQNKSVENIWKYALCIFIPLFIFAFIFR